MSTTTTAPAKKASAKKRPPAKRSGGTTVSEKIRRRLLNGEVLRASDVAKQYNATPTILSSVMATMRKSGAKFAQIERGVWQMTTPTKGAPGPGPRKAQRKAQRKAPARKAVSRPSVGPPALPETGEVYECFLSMIDDNGDTVIGFRNGDETWFVRPIEAEVLIPA